MSSYAGQFEGANLTKHGDYWRSVTSNECVLQWLEQGVPLPVTEKPRPFELPNRTFSAKESSFINEEVQVLLSTKCIAKCRANEAFYVSPINTVPKKDSFRLITDLRHLNGFLKPPKCAYEDIDDVIKTVQPSDHLVTLDIKNGFFHIPVKQEDTNYLCFKWKDQYYKWLVLPFGCNYSPYFFVKVVRSVIEHLRNNNVRIVGYVDDFLICDHPATINKTRDWVLEELKNLGWFLNVEKCQLVPANRARYIGYIVETRVERGDVVLTIPKERITKVKRDIARILRKGTATARGLARVAGQCISMTKAVLPAKLLLRNLYRCLAQKKSWQDSLCIDPATEVDLRWWHTALTSWNGRTFKSGCKDIVQIATDASQEGWGAKVLGGQDSKSKAQGFWDSDMAQNSSNQRELTAVLLALMSFLERLKGKTVQILTDNICTAAYVNFQGGPCEQLHRVATKIWTLVLTNNIDITAKYLRGVLNVQADELSRVQSQYEWALHPRLFQYLDNVWGPHTIDRFASMNTTQTVKYNSRFLDPCCLGVDALYQSDWGYENNFVNAPITVLDRVIQIIVEQKADATVIAPMWRAKIWCQKLRQMSIAAPIKLPKAKYFCLQKGIRQPEPLKNTKWIWYAWRVSGRAI